MNTFIQNEPLIYDLKFTDDELIVYLKDGRVLNVPIVWYPTLTNATKKELNNYEIIGDGEGIHWIDLDEDLSIKGFLQGISLDNSVDIDSLGGVFNKYADPSKVALEDKAWELHVKDKFTK